MNLSVEPKGKHANLVLELKHGDPIELKIHHSRPVVTITFTTEELRDLRNTVGQFLIDQFEEEALAATKKVSGAKAQA